MEFNPRPIAGAQYSWRKPVLVVIVLMLCGASPTPSSLPSASPSALPSLAPLNFKSLLKEFVNAQRTELKAMDHRYKFELKELKASQDARWKEWKKKEDDARHKFFEEHKGPEKRPYVMEFRQRKDNFRKLLSEEWVRRKQEQEVHTNSIRQDQVSKLKEFKLKLDKGEKPSVDLWPKAGR